MLYSLISALSNPVRLKLILCLSKKRKCVEELIVNCNLSQSAISQHLNKLRKSKIVKTEKEGKYVYYSLSSKKAVKIIKLINDLEKEVK